MPLFLSDEEFRLCAHDSSLVAEKADSYIKALTQNFKAIGKDGDVEQLSVEISELHKSKRQLLDLLDQRDSEIAEKNITIKSYLDKIVNLTESSALKEARLHYSEAELARSQATHSHLSQENELFLKHSKWLSDELRAKLKSLSEHRKTHTEFEADMTAKLVDVEKRFNDCSSALERNKERVRELDLKLTSAQEVLVDLQNAKEEIEKLKEEAQASISKDHMQQYKEISQVNEAALKQMESAHEKFKAKAEKVKKSLEAKVLSLQERIYELKKDIILKSGESAAEGKEEALSFAASEIDRLKEENARKTYQLMEMEIQRSSLKEDMQKEHLRWHTAENNYERQVILHAETIQELHKLADTKKSENDILKSAGETEKSILLDLKELINEDELHNLWNYPI